MPSKEKRQRQGKKREIMECVKESLVYSSHTKKKFLSASAGGRENPPPRGSGHGLAPKIARNNAAGIRYYLKTVYLFADVNSPA